MCRVPSAARGRPSDAATIRTVLARPTADKVRTQLDTVEDQTAFEDTPISTERRSSPPTRWNG
ncbi:hypothetical protein GCM10010348_70810 [Streptomyces anthocyanicus]|nr:hypothetical protein GCM10010348_70810 [Streptomyces anthocyanicus]